MGNSDAGGSAALHFVAACCRWPDDQARRELVQQRSADVRDWASVLDLAAAHRVEGMVADAIRSADLGVPESVARWGAERRETMRGQAMLEIGETLRVCDALEGIRFKVLKGVALGVLAFGRPALKRSWDVDVLIDHADAIEAARRITALGYAPAKPPRVLDAEELRRWSSVSKHASLASPKGIEVELHWRPTSLPGMLRDISAEGPARMVALLGDRSVPTLTDDAQLAYLAVHGTSHGWSRLKWLADFSGFVATIPTSELERTIAAAERHGTGEAIAASFLVREKLFGFALPDWILASARAREIASLSLQVLTARTADRAIEDDREAMRATERIRRLMGRGRGYVPAYLMHRHRGSEIRALVALPRWLDWAYWLIRPYSFLRRLALRFGS